MKWMIVFLLIPTIVHAKFAWSGEDVPVERLVANVNAYIKAHPTEAAGYYTLGRIYALAYAKDGAQVDVELKGDELPRFAPYASVLEAARETPFNEKAREHLRLSLENYERATSLDSENALYWLGYGFMLDQAAIHERAATQPTTLPSSPVPGSDVKALAAYTKAFDLALNRDKDKKHIGPRADSAISYEAARYAIKLIERVPSPKDFAERRDRFEKGMRTLGELPVAMTPVILPLDRARSLNELVSDSTVVQFDLTGLETKQRWSWVSPETGILVWDPQQTGVIKSARQLFGNATWHLFWNDGYAPLAMLDDNRDGELAGQELDGLSIWQDRDSDGASDAGEVKTVRDWGITKIGVSAKSIGGVLESTVTFSDGRQWKTFDWVARAR